MLVDMLSLTSTTLGSSEILKGIGKVAKGFTLRINGKEKLLIGKTLRLIAKGVVTLQLQAKPLNQDTLPLVILNINSELL